MLCEECRQRQATVHMTKIINNLKSEIHLCEKCANRHEEFTNITPFSMNDLIASLMDMGAGHQTFVRSASVKCPACGMDYAKFKKSGMLGCRECYQHFSNELLPVLRKIQSRTEHSGKVPKRSGSSLLLKKQIKELRQELKIAVETEAFERAAEIRDRLKELEASFREQGRDLR